MNIKGVEVNVEAHRNNDHAGHVGVFAHLKGKEQTEAVAELEKALQKDDSDLLGFKKVEPAAVSAENAPPEESDTRETN